MDKINAAPDYIFHTKRFRVEYVRTDFLSYALIFDKTSRSEWPLAAEVDKLSRQTLIRKACLRVTDALLCRLPKLTPTFKTNYLTVVSAGFVKAVADRSSIIGDKPAKILGDI